MLNQDQLIFISESDQFESEIAAIFAAMDPDDRSDIIDLLYSNRGKYGDSVPNGHGRDVSMACLVALARVGFNHLTTSRIHGGEDEQPV